MSAVMPQPLINLMLFAYMATAYQYSAAELTKISIISQENCKATPQ